MSPYLSSFFVGFPYIVFWGLLNGGEGIFDRNPFSDFSYFRRRKQGVTELRAPFKSQYLSTDTWVLSVGWKGKFPFSGGWQPREKVDLCPKTISKDSAQPWKLLKGESFGEWDRVFDILHCVQTFFWLVGDEVTGWCSRNLVLSLKSPSST